MESKSPEYISAMSQGTGVQPAYCGQCGSTCRGCLKEQIPNHPYNKIKWNKPLPKEV